MFEVKSAGVTIEMTHSHDEAFKCFEQSKGAEVILYKYNSAGNKVAVQHKFGNSSRANSKFSSLSQILD